MSIPENIQEILDQDPGNAIFIEYAEKLRNAGDSNQAILVCIRGLSSNPALHRGRFLLARIFYEQGHVPFAVRELKEISKSLPEVEPLRRLIARFEPGAGEQGNLGQSETVAETDFDIEELELAGEEEK